MPLMVFIGKKTILAGHQKHGADAKRKLIKEGTFESILKPSK